MLALIAIMTPTTIAVSDVEMTDASASAIILEFDTEWLTSSSRRVSSLNFS